MFEKVSDPTEISEPAPSEADFAGAMRQFADEAERPKPATAGDPPAASKSVRGEFLLIIGQMIRPLAVGIEGLGRTLAEHGQALTKLAAAPPPAPPTVDLSPVNTALDGVRGQLARIGNVESANQKLFDALHGELKGYKDGFLFDALQKPFVRDLISLHDDLGALHGQIEARRGKAPEHGGEDAFLNTLAQNFDNALAGLLETLTRMDVELQRTEENAPVDKRVHRIMSFEPATDAAGDGRVARSMRPGFLWRGRAVRSEEIVARRWTELPPAAPVSAESSAPTLAPVLANRPTPDTLAPAPVETA